MPLDFSSLSRAVSRLDEGLARHLATEEVDRMTFPTLVPGFLAEARELLRRLEARA